MYKPTIYEIFIVIIKISKRLPHINMDVMKMSFNENK